jgi:hypothetical protein
MDLVGWKYVFVLRLPKETVHISRNQTFNDMLFQLFQYNWKNEEFPVVDISQV